MRRNTQKIASLLFIVLALVGIIAWLEPRETLAATDLSPIAVGARSIGMGRATTALADDANTLFTNPAGLSLLDQFHFTSMNTRLLGDVSYNMIGGAYQIPQGTLGFGYVNASIGEIPLTVLDANNRPVSAGTTNYDASILLFSYGNRLEVAGMKNLHVGGTLKRFSEGFSSSSVQNGTASGMDLDIGLLYQHNTWLQMGALGKNVLPATMGGNLTWGTGKKEGLPAKLQLGISSLLLGEGSLTRGTSGTWRVNADAELSPTSTAQPTLWHLGTEFRPTQFNQLALRAGLDQSATSNGSGGAATSNDFTLGLGIRLDSFTFDYAYHQFQGLDTTTSHFFSFGFNPEAKQEVKNPISEKRAAIPTVEYRALKAVTFTDVLDDYWARQEVEGLATIGLVQGYPDGTFRPERPVTRAELASILVKAKGLELPKQFVAPFSDVEKSHWAASYISVAADQGWIQGYPDNTFKPMNNVTRAEVISILARFDQLPVSDVIKDSPFPDIALGHWAIGNIAAAKKAGMLPFLEGKDLEAARPTTRAETTVMTARTTFTKQRTSYFLKRLQEEGYVLERQKKPLQLLHTPNLSH